jgi:hypothetical protein
MHFFICHSISYQVNIYQQIYEISLKNQNIIKLQIKKNIGGEAANTFINLFLLVLAQIIKFCTKILNCSFLF